MTDPHDKYWRTLGLAAPARRALIHAEIYHLNDLCNWRATDLAALHGIGAHAMQRLLDALAQANRSFMDEKTPQSHQ